MIKNLLSIFTVKKVVGLYIGHDTVDLVVLKGTLKGPRLVKFGQTSILPKERTSEEIMPEAVDKNQQAEGDSQKSSRAKSRDDYIVDAIQRVFRENDVKPKNVVVGIPSEEIMVRYFQMPKIPKQEWASAINFEAKRYIPFRMEEVASDFQGIPSKTSSGGLDVVFSAIKQRSIERFIQLLEKAGVRPLVVEPAPFSLVRVFTAAEQISSNVNTVIVNIDAKIACIIILRNGIPYIIRDIPLDESASVSSDKSLEPIFEKLLGEIKLSFDFYEKQFPAEVIDKILIYSQLPLENWHELVGKELQIAVEIGDPLRGIRIKRGVVPPRLAISFGLALRGISKAYLEVNLYKERLLVYKRKELFLRTLFLEASAAVFLLIILKVLTMRALAPLTKELERTLSERPKSEVSVRIDDATELERTRNNMDIKREALEHLLSKRTYFTGRMMDLAKIVPQNIWLTEISFEEAEGKKDISKVSRKLMLKGYYLITGRVSETDAINNFLKSLQEGDAVSNGMNKADIVSVERTEVNGEKVARFEIVFSGR